MKPKVLRLISVRNRSGRLEISRSPSMILPVVGLAMHPRIARRVVFPLPLGPHRTVTRLDSMVRVTPRRAANSFGLPALKTLPTSDTRITLGPHDRVGVNGGGPPGGDDGRD